MKQNLSIDVDAAQFGAASQDMVQALNFGSFEPALKECLEEGQKDIARNFAAQASSHGGTWAPRKSKQTGPGTFENNRLQGTHPLLIDTGLMFQAETSDFGEGHVENLGYREATSGVDPEVVPYAGFHQFGAPGANIPARPSVDLSDETVDTMAELIADRGVELLMGRE